MWPGEGTRPRYVRGNRNRVPSPAGTRPDPWAGRLAGGVGVGGGRPTPFRTGGLRDAGRWRAHLRHRGRSLTEPCRANRGVVQAVVSCELWCRARSGWRYTNAPRLLPARCQPPRGGIGPPRSIRHCGMVRRLYRSCLAVHDSFHGRRAAWSARSASLRGAHGHCRPHQRHWPWLSDSVWRARIRWASRHRSRSTTSVGSQRSVPTNAPTPKLVIGPRTSAHQGKEPEAQGSRTACATVPI